MEIAFGKQKYETRTPKTMFRRMVLVLWGPSGCGKTTLAATAPRPIFNILFDPDGDSSIPEADDIHTFDMTQFDDTVAERFKDKEFVRGIVQQAVDQEPDLKTLIFDSMTTFGDKALSFGVRHAASARPKEGITLEDPGFGGYGRKSIWSMMLLKNLTEVTAEFGLNCIIIAHEDTPTKDNKGNILFTTMMVGGNIAEKTPVRVNECWYMYINSKGEHMVLVKNARGKKPMKTRMFDNSQVEFSWKFDPITWEGMKIEDWLEEWRENEGAKLALPS